MRNDTLLFCESMAEHIFEMEIALLIQMKTSEHRNPAFIILIRS